MADIPLGEVVRDYFGKRKELVSDLPTYAQLKRGKLTYTWQDLARMPPEETTSENPYWDIPDEAREAATQIVSRLYNAPRELVTIDELAEMHSGKTLPVKIDASVDGVSKTCYAKLPNAARFLSQELYNIFSGNKPLDFVFNEGIYVDDKAPGRVRVEWDPEELMTNAHYVENLIRLDQVCNIVGLNDLRMNGNNTSIDNEGNIFLFDFDEGLKFRRESLTDGLPVKDEYIGSVQADERRLIARRAEKEIGRVAEVLMIMQKYDFNVGEAAQYQIPGANNMGDVVMHMLDYMSKE